VRRDVRMESMRVNEPLERWDLVAIANNDATDAGRDQLGQRRARKKPVS